MRNCGIATWALKGLVGLIAFFFFLSPAHGKQAGKKYYIYDNGQVHVSENPNVYVDKNGTPTLVIRRATAGGRHREGRTVYETVATTAFVSSKTQANQVLEAMMNSPHRNQLVKPIEIKKEERREANPLKPQQPAAKEGKRAEVENGNARPDVSKQSEGGGTNSEEKTKAQLQAMK